MKEYAAPRMHTAEHILNQTMVRMFGKGRSFSSHIERRKSKCDYHFDRDLTEQERTEIESTVNEVISLGLAISEDHIPYAEAESRYSLSRLPEGVGETLRIVMVGDYDACPCSGQHVSNSTEVGRFRIISSSYENGVLRIRFKLEDA